ncbi:MAG: hypothetical protein WA672_00015 [Candidatus Angelobacter sp.]
MLVLEESTANDAGIVEGAKFALTASDSTVADALTSFRSKILTTAAKDRDDVALSVEVADGRVLEMPVLLLKKKLLDSDSAKSAANHGTDPIVITRSYVGTLTFILKKKSTAGGQVLAQLAQSRDLPANGSVKIDANRTGEGILRIAVGDPVVFAFEASSASYVTHHLGSSPDDVNLTPVKPRSFVQENPPQSSSNQTAVRWSLATVSSGYYKNLRTLDQAWNASSADLTEDTLRAFGPSSTLKLRATPDSPLTARGLTDFINAVGSKAKADNSGLIVLYYIGHTLSWPNRDIAVVLGDAESIPETKRNHSAKAIHRALGEKVGSLVDLADALQANLEELPSGFMPLRDLYAELEKTGIPFVILLDGCLRNDEFEQFRDGLGIVGDAQTRTFFYVGPDGRLLYSLDEFDRALRHFADTLPYLHTSNPVIMAAKPGTFAQPWTNPQLSWEPSGPLAARLSHYIRASIFDVDQPTLGSAISNITDYQGTGEISPKGSISWSDFNQVKNATAGLKSKLF